MFAVRATFDGKGIQWPDSVPNVEPCEVIVVFGGGWDEESRDWKAAQESGFAAVWDNDEDSVYDNL